MLTAHHLSKSFASQNLFSEISFSLSQGDRVGLVGPNGCGKTTLLKILAGIESPTSGSVSSNANLRIGYLPQGFEPIGDQTLADMLGSLSDPGVNLYENFETCATDFARDPDNFELQSRYDDLLRQIEQAESGRTANILSGLGLAGLSPDIPVRLLSGGQQTRLLVARLLLSEPELLLLDEPTNHLDIAMLEWLENWLASCQHAMLIVSHDRTFLDHTVKRIFEMDPQRDPECTLHEYEGNYSAYLEQRQGEIEKQWKAYNDQHQEIKRMKADIARTKSQAAYTERQASSIRIGGPDMKIKGFKSYQQGIAKKVAAKAKARETRLAHYIESDERVDKPMDTWQQRRGMRMNLEKPQHVSRLVLRLEEAAIGYRLQAPLLSNVELNVVASQHIGITGPNGAGKTTLLRTLAGELPLLGGKMSVGENIRLGYMSQDQTNLESKLSPVDLIQTIIPNETKARNFLAQYLFTGDEPLKQIRLLSYGQRSRLMLAMLVAQGSNLLLLDEPINHLDIPSRAQFEAALQQFKGAILAVVHDRYFIERFANEIWYVENGGIRAVKDRGS